jgi:glycine betaine/proline transport system ATP-binding protein
VIRLRGVTKVFGPDPQLALPLLAQGLTKTELLESLGAVLALDAIDLEIEARAIHVVMGLSGSGKSTLVRLINRLIEPTAGSIRIDDIEVTQLAPTVLTELRRKRIAMVFQSFALFPHMSVRDNVAYGLKIQGVEATKRSAAADDWLERVGLTGYAERYPAELSGGMRQRVGLARALATGADILLMDEPFGALDPLIRAEMQSLLLGLQSELGKTIVFITHDLAEALRIGERVSILRDGKLIQTDGPERIVLHPADDYVAQFVKSVDRARVLSCGAIVRRAPAEVAGPQLAATLSLGEAAALLAHEKAESGLVVSAADQVLGRLTLTEIVSAMAAERSRTS